MLSKSIREPDIYNCTYAHDTNTPKNFATKDKAKAIYILLYEPERTSIVCKSNVCCVRMYAEAMANGNTKIERINPYDCPSDFINAR